MKIHLINIAHILCLMAIPFQTRADIIYPLGNSNFGFDYDRLYRAGVEMGDISQIPTIGPIFLNEAEALFGEPGSASLQMFNIDDAIEYPGDAIAETEPPLRLSGIASESFRVIKNHRPDDLPSLTAGFVYLPGQHFGAVSFFNLDRARAVDPEYTGKKYRGLAGDIETAALLFNKDRISVTLGRSRIFWGPQRINLLLSETAYPLDLLSASYQTSLLRFSFLFARLDGSHPDQIDSLRFPDGAFNDNRYLVGHRLDIKLHRRLKVGFFETVLYGGEGRPPELYYLNPLQFFHGAQLNEDQDDNTIIGLDFTCMPGWNTNFYGQLIVDDFQIDDESQGDKEPNEIGFMLGIFRAGKIASLIPDVKLEYVRLTNRTYHQRDPRNRYLYRNKPLGHPLGPDADSVSISFRFWPDNLFFAEAELAYRRKGEGSIHEPWDEPWLLATGDYSEPFPTGVVEKAALIAVKVRGYIPITSYLRNHFFLSLQTGWGEIRNYLNIEGRTETVANIQVQLSWLGFTDIGID